MKLVCRQSPGANIEIFEFGLKPISISLSISYSSERNGFQDSVIFLAPHSLIRWYSYG
jgi:hypothetical protein